MDIITTSEKGRLDERLAELTGRRGEIRDRIAAARALGDLKENGDYHAAREQQGIDEAEIKRLTERLSEVSVVSEDQVPDDIVFVGTTVRICEEGDDEDEVIKLVGEASSDPMVDPPEVTANSPMGEALMKSRVGEVVRVDTPRGVKRFKVLEIL